MRTENGMHMRISGAPGVLVEESRHGEILHSSEWVFMICRWYAQFFPAVKRLVATKSTSLPVNDQKIRTNVPTFYIRKRNLSVLSLRRHDRSDSMSIRWPADPHFLRRPASFYTHIHIIHLFYNLVIRWSFNILMEIAIL